jgi:hypothetical protein
MKFITLTAVNSAHGKGIPWTVNVDYIESLEPVRQPEVGTYIQVGKKEQWVRETREEIVRRLGVDLV